MFYTLDGRVEVLSGAALITAEAGDVIVVPPRSPQAFAAERSSSADILIIITPGIERFEYFRQLTRSARGEERPERLQDVQELYDNYSYVIRIGKLRANNDNNPCSAGPPHRIALCIGSSCRSPYRSISMSFYARHILPHLVDLAMRNKETTRLGTAWIPHARGDALEIGIGSGLNLPFYSAQVQHVYGVDPSLELRRIARKRATGHLDVQFLPQSAEERLPLRDASIDKVVITWTLCSIPNPDSALQQMRRVVKPGGRLLFTEHGRSSDPGVEAWQDRLTSPWKCIAGGCHLNRKVDDLITAARFQITELKTFYLPGPHPMTYTYQGFAQIVS